MAEQVLKTYFNTGTESLIFDAVFSTQHDTSLNITEHPVQTGADIADHAYEEAARLTFDIGMSDVMTSIVPGQFSGTSRSVSAYKKLRDLQHKRLPITVITRLGTYNNMMVETISTTDDSKTTYGLRATVTLKQIFVVSVTTVKISERPHKSEQTNEGDQKVIKADKSLLASLLGN
ncbi:TPA: phage baseplate protein [Clostridium botulinum]